MAVYCRLTNKISINLVERLWKSSNFPLPSVHCAILYTYNRMASLYQKLNFLILKKGLINPTSNVFCVSFHSVSMGVFNISNALIVIENLNLLMLINI